MIDRNFIYYLNEEEIQEGIRVANRENYNVQCYLEFLDSEKHKEISSFIRKNQAV